MQIPLFYLFGYLLHSEEISDQSTHTNGSNFIGADQELKENIYGDAGFPTGFKNMGGCAHPPPPLRGGSSKFDGWGLSQYKGGAWGGLKSCQKIPVKEFI